MGTLLVAYIAVWMGVSLYVARLGVRQRRIERRLEALQVQLEHKGKANDSAVRAA